MQNLISNNQTYLELYQKGVFFYIYIYIYIYMGGGPNLTPYIIYLDVYLSLYIYIYIYEGGPNLTPYEICLRCGLSARSSTRPTHTPFKGGDTPTSEVLADELERRASRP